MLANARNVTRVLHDYPRKYYGMLGPDCFVYQDGSVGIYEVNANNMLDNLANEDNSKLGLDLYEDALTLLGLRINIKDGKVINPVYGKDNPDIHRI